MNVPENYPYKDYHAEEISITKEEELALEEELLREKNETFERKDKILINGALLRVAYFLELLVSIILIISIVVTMLDLLRSLGVLVLEAGSIDEFQTFLASMFSVVIGIEFLKMLCGYNMDAVVEVILFTIARQLVLNHASAVEQLLSITAIAILFMIRKFLFVKKLDEKPEDQIQDTITRILKRVNRQDAPKNQDPPKKDMNISE